MIYLVTGDDFKKANAAFNRYAEILRGKQPAASIFTFAPEDFDPGQFEEVARGATLFLDKHIALGRRLGESEAASELIKSLVKTIAAAPSVFVFYEPAADGDLAKLLAQHAKEVKTFVAKIETKKSFNIFALTDELGERDRQKLWVTYQRALRAGVTPDEVFWKFVWQVKNMLLVSTVKDVQTTGLKLFVAAKALKGSRNFSPPELTKLLNNLIDLLAATFPESDEFAFGLEKIILSV